MTLLEGNNKQIVEARTRICAHVHDVRIDDPDERPNHLSGGYAKIFIFLRRLAHNRPGINRIAPARNFSNAEYRKLRSLRVMAEVITEWAFRPSFMSGNEAFQNEFRIGRNHHRECLGTDHRNSLPAKEPRKSDFIDVLGQRQYRSHHE